MKVLRNASTLVATFASTVLWFSAPVQASDYKLEDIYNAGQPLKWEELLENNSPELAAWNCTGVPRDNGQAEVLNMIPVRVKGQIETAPAQVAAGPEYPATPAQYKSIDGIIWRENNAKAVAEPIDMTDRDFKLNLDNGVSSEQYGNGYTFIDLHLLFIGGWPVPVRVTQTFRSNSGMIVIKTQTNNPGILFDYPYIYCYKL